MTRCVSNHKDRQTESRSRLPYSTNLIILIKIPNDIILDQTSIITYKILIRYLR
jgi:hypothetical protein